MNQPVSTQNHAASTETPICKSDWRFFAFVAGIIMPSLMVGSLIVYGFVVWFMQIFLAIRFS